MATLKQVPEAFQVVGMHLAVHILDGVVGDGMFVVGVQPFVGQQFIAEDGRASFHMPAHLSPQRSVSLAR
jgi:hypothetical protein